MEYENVKEMRINLEDDIEVVINVVMDDFVGSNKNIRNILILLYIWKLDVFDFIMVDFFGIICVLVYG